MAFISEARLDKLEPFFTKETKRWQNGGPPRWVASLSPSVLLKPNETYTRQLFLREVSVIGMGTDLLLVLVFVIAPFVYFWYQCPWLFTDPKAHRAFIASLSSGGFYQTPIVLIFTLVSNYAINWPRYYFWNRRAARLQANPVVEQGQPVMVIDPGVWPPPPNRPVV